MLTLSAESALDINALVDKALHNIYDQNYSGPFEPNLWQITTSELNRAVDEVWGKNPPLAVDKTLVNHLKYQNAVFAAFKSTHQTRTLVQLRNAAGVQSYSDFARVTRKTVGDYNDNWLKAEYATAKRSLRSAKQYANALDNTDLYPMIEYMPSRSQNPREAHRPYYHVVRPVTDTFWATHLPPLDWRCDCWWETRADGQTDIPEGLPAPQPGLDNNPAISGTTFSQHHPYFEGLTADTKKEVVKRTACGVANRKPEELTLFEYNTKSNGCVVAFAGTAQSSDYEAVKNACMEFAKEGSMAEITPRIHPKDPMYQQVYKALIGTPYEGKSPDFKVNGLFYEHEGFRGDNPKNALRHMLKRGLKQSSRLVIEDCSVTDRYLIRNILIRVKDGQKIDEVYVQNKSGLRLVYKKTEAQ